MENVLELIRNSKSFKKYIEILKKYHELPTSNEVELKMLWESLNFEDALLSLINIDKLDNGYKLHVDVMAGDSELFKGEKRGRASYDVIVSNLGEDALVSGIIKVVFDCMDTYGFDPNGGEYDINETAVNEDVNETIKDGAKFLNSRHR